MSTLQELREKQGFSRNQAAMRLGVTVESVYNWESGRHMPRADTVFKMVHVYQCPIDTLLEAVGKKRGE